MSGRAGRGNDVDEGEDGGSEEVTTYLIHTFTTK